MPTQQTLCPHCVELAHDIRRVASVLQAESHHHLMAAVIAARAEGRSERAVLEALRFLLESAHELDAPITTARGVDVEIVSIVPPAAVEAQVLYARGERGC